MSGPESASFTPGPGAFPLRAERGIRNASASHRLPAPVGAGPDPTALTALFAAPERAAVLRLMTDTLHADLLLLERACARGDGNAAADALHRTLGSLCLLGPMPLRDDGRALLQGLREGAVAAGAADFSHYRHRLAALAGALEQAASERAARNAAAARGGEPEVQAPA